MSTDSRISGRNWLFIIVIASMFVLLWDGGGWSGLHFHWNVPFWPVALILFAFWWIRRGDGEACGSGCCDGCNCGKDHSEQDDESGAAEDDAEDIAE